MKKKILSGIILAAVFAVVVYCIVAVAVIYFENGFRFSVRDFTLTNGTIWLFWIAALAIAGIFAFANSHIRTSKRVLEKNYLEDSHWLTIREIKTQEKETNANLKITTLKQLNNVKDGIPISAEVNSKGTDVNIVLANPIHTLILGTTGSGKTSGFVDPTIQILSRCKTRPSMVLTDPKGELYIMHAKTLKEQGYDVQVIDLVDVYHSSKWNPFQGVLKKTEELKALGIAPTIITKKGRYFFDNKEYATYNAAIKARNDYMGEFDKESAIRAQQLTDEIYEDIHDIIYTICPIENKNDSTWQTGARDLIFALALAFWEDCRDELMRPEQLNLYNLYKNISTYCDNQCADFKEFFANRSKFSKTKGLANTVLVSQDKTLTSYLGDVNQYFQWMADNGLASLTSGNDVYFDKFDEQPTALFLRIPDHKETRYKIVKLLVSQMYKTLVDKADANERKGITASGKPELLRNVYFIIDEFLNLPKFEGIDVMLRVGRGRKIFYLPIIQDYAGLDAKYTKDLATSIRSNCNIEIFIGTNDKTTAEEFSQKCGKQKVRNISFSVNKDESVSIGAQERPLIYASELRELNDPPRKMGNAIVKAFGKPTYKAKYTPLFTINKLYNIASSKLAKADAEIFDEANIFYDIAARNAFIAEERALAQSQEELLQATLAKFRQNTKEEVSKDELIDMQHERIKARLASLIGKISNVELEVLMAAETSNKTRLEVLTRLTDEAEANGNVFLMFELIQLKAFIETIFDIEFYEKNNYANA